MAKAAQCRGCISWVHLVVLVLVLAVSASAEWKEEVLHRFQNAPDGVQPIGGVVFDKQGNLYGATLGGGWKSCAWGENGCGAVFQLSPPHAKQKAWTERILHAFKGNAFGDGAAAGGGLILDNAGNLYGVTYYGGSGDCVLVGTKVGCGAIYELSPPTSKHGAWTETIIYSFPTNRDGQVPAGSLVFDKDGNLYGATEFGGSSNDCGFTESGCGAIFELSPPRRKRGPWTERVLHRFGGNQDGGGPTGSLVQDSKGNLYGNTVYGGGLGQCYTYVSYCGTVFELVRPKDSHSPWSEVLIHRYTGGSDGGAPAPTSGLARDALGRLYGTQQVGAYVVQFVLQNGAWKWNALPCCGDQLVPEGGIVLDRTGNLYATASTNTTNHGGGVFRIHHSSKGWSMTSLYDFSNAQTGHGPWGALTLDHAGNVYGVTAEGGAQKCAQLSYGCGTVFKLTP